MKERFNDGILAVRFMVLDSEMVKAGRFAILHYSRQ
jgi:hypothetical protein